MTFRQVDPLFVFDLKDPAAPKLLGELKIPGFSDYMHPLDEGHLLTIGRDTDENGRVLGLALQIFDVTDPVLPRRAHKFVYTGGEYGWSEANWNHKAFTYFADKKLLAFPYLSWGNSTMRSSLEVFDVDAQAGIRKRGSVDHTTLFGTNTQGYCGGYYSPVVRRGVFLEDTVFSISYGGVVATDTRDMTGAPIASLGLPRPKVEGYPGCVD